MDREHPFQVTCPAGGEVYPSNDFNAWYKGGRKEKLDTHEKYVDDGCGWVDQECVECLGVAGEIERLMHADLGKEPCRVDTARVVPKITQRLIEHRRRRLHFRHSEGAYQHDRHPSLESSHSNGPPLQHVRLHWSRPTVAIHLHVVSTASSLNCSSVMGSALRGLSFHVNESRIPPIRVQASIAQITIFQATSAP